MDNTSQLFLPLHFSLLKIHIYDWTGIPHKPVWVMEDFGKENSDYRDKTYLNKKQKTFSVYLLCCHHTGTSLPQSATLPPAALANKNCGTFVHPQLEGNQRGESERINLTQLTVNMQNQEIKGWKIFIKVLKQMQANLNQWMLHKLMVDHRQLSVWKIAERCPFCPINCRAAGFVIC